jgi:hypothetical protein
MSELEKLNKLELAQSAWEMYVKGYSYSAIGRKLDLHRHTVRKYVEDFSDAIDTKSPNKQLKLSDARLDRLMLKIEGWIESGQIPLTSRNLPELVAQQIHAIKEQNRIHGLHKQSIEIGYDGATLAALFARPGAAAELQEIYMESMREEEIVDAEIVEPESDS